MLSYAVKRGVVALLTILLVATITFFLMNAVPGSPFMTEKSTPDQIAKAEARYGLDKPLIVQYKNYLVNFAKGDLGVSLKMQQDTPVKTIIFGQGKFTLSMKTGFAALVISIIAGIALGSLAAYYRGRWLDNILRVFTTFGVAVPAFVVASMLLIFFGVRLGWLPVLSGSLENPAAYVMPVMALSLYPTCYIAKLTRTSMLDVINQDYIRTARAKGLGTGKIIFKHALRNSLIPVVTYLGPLTAGIMTGSFVVETTFGIPGLGKYFINSITNRDYPIIMATTIVLAALVILMNFVVDILYKAVDPRIKLVKEKS